jgi:hypothetical protein
MDVDNCGVTLSATLSRYVPGIVDTNHDTNDTNNHSFIHSFQTRTTLEELLLASTYIKKGWIGSHANSFKAVCVTNCKQQMPLPASSSSSPKKEAMLASSFLWTSTMASPP